VSSCRQATGGLPAQPARHPWRAGNPRVEPSAQAAVTSEAPTRQPFVERSLVDEAPHAREVTEWRGGKGWRQPLFEIVEDSGDDPPDEELFRSDDGGRRPGLPAISHARELLELLRLESQRERLVEPKPRRRAGGDAGALRRATSLHTDRGGPWPPLPR
jgi:hypothetical protein